MTAETTVAANAWDDAVRRATAVAGRERPGGMDEDCWDDVAIRDIIAMVLYALHVRGCAAVDAVPWSSVLWWLWDDEHVIALVEDSLPGTAQALTEPGVRVEDAVLARWRWLNRTWDPEAPVRRRNRTPAPRDALFPQEHDTSGGPLPEPRWDGMTRGIGNGLPDPAIEVCTHWAAGAVAAVYSAEQGGLAVHQRIHVHAGQFAGQGGYVRDIGWNFHDDTQQVTGPAGYVVDLDDTEGTERIDAAQMEAAGDRQWADRPEDTLKAGPLLAPAAPLPPTQSCAQDLEALLAGARNPEALPEEVRQAIRGARSHHHLDMRRLASPRPRRATVQLLLHWYQVTEHYVEDPAGRAEIWELVVTDHLRDKDPVRLLATSEQAAKELAQQHTGLEL